MDFDNNLEIYDYNITFKYIHLTANKYYKEKDVFNALILYDQLLDVLIDNNIRSLLYSNKSGCYLYLKDYVNTLKNGLHSLENNNTNSKAWGRIGWAFKGLKKHKDAVNAFKIASKLNPNNINYKNEIYFYTSKKINNNNLFDLFKSSKYIMTKLSNKEFKNKLLMNICNPNNLLSDHNFLHLIDYIVDKIN